MPMPIIRYDGNDYSCEQEESLLDCLTRHGVALASSCRAGVCQTCLMHCSVGKPPVAAQKGLKDTYQAQGYFLACICHPNENMSVGLTPLTNQWQSTHVMSKTSLGQDICKLSLSIPEGFQYEAGQFINLKNDEGVTRSYSIASLPSEGCIDLHIKRIENGKVSTWLCDHVKPNDAIEINGPIGHCFYLPELDPNNEKNLLLVGTGTGLAPLYGIIKSALVKNHQQKIHLFHGSITRETLYLVTELTKLSEQHTNFLYTPCILQGEPKNIERQGDLINILKNTYPSLKGWKGYLCGDPDIVKKLRMQCFMSGISMEHIYADPFESASH